MTTTLPIRLFALLCLPLAAAFAQESAHDDAAAPGRVRRVMLAPAAPAAPAQPLQPAEPSDESAPERGRIGVYLGPEDEAPGAAVRGLVQGSGAESAGLQPGDRILAIGDRRIASSAELIEVVKSKRAGDTVDLMVDRDGWRKRISVQLQPASAEPPTATRRQMVEVLEELERDADPEGRPFASDHDGGELDELRKLIELHGDQPGEVRVERRIWIDGEEVSPEQGDAPRRIRWRVESDAERGAEERREVEARRQRELRMERAQQQRERMQAEAERRVERELRAERELRTERELRGESRPARAELDELRRELRELRREVEELRRALEERRR